MRGSRRGNDVPAREGTGQSDAPVVVIGRHKGVVTSLAFMAATGYLATGSSDSRIMIWDIGATEAVGGRCVQTLAAHEGTVTALAAHCDILVSGGADRVVKVWKLEPGRRALGHPWLAVAQAFVLDAWVTSIWAAPLKSDTMQGEVLVGDGKGCVTAFRSAADPSANADGGSPSTGASPRGSRAGPSGGRLGGGPGSAAGSAESAPVTAIAGLELLKQQAPEALHGISLILPVPELNAILTLSVEPVARVRDIVSLTTMTTIPHPSGCARFVGASWDSVHEEVLLVDGAGDALVWSTRSSSFVARCSVAPNPASCVPGGVAKNVVWVAHRDGVTAAAVRRLRTVQSLGAHTDRVLALMPVDQGTMDDAVLLAATLSASNVNMGAELAAAAAEVAAEAGVTPRMLAAAGGQPAAPPSMKPELTDLPATFVTASVDNTIRFWSASLACQQHFTETRSEISSFALLRAAAWCVSGHGDGSVKFWGPRGVRSFRFTAHSNTVSVVGEGQHKHGAGRSAELWPHIFTASYDGSLALWELPGEGGKARRRSIVRVAAAEILCAVYDPMNHQYIVGANDGTLCTFGLEELKAGIVFRGRRSSAAPDGGSRSNRRSERRSAGPPGEDVNLTSLASAPDEMSGLQRAARHNSGSNICSAAAADDFDVGVVAHRGGVTCLALDGNALFSGSEDETVAMWNAVDGTLMRRLRHPLLPDGISEVQALVVRPDTGGVLAATRSGLVVLFDQRTGVATAQRELPREACAAAWYREEKEFLVAMEDGCIAHVHASGLTPVALPPQDGGAARAAARRSVDLFGSLDAPGLSAAGEKGGGADEEGALVVLLDALRAADERKAVDSRGSPPRLLTPDFQPVGPPDPRKDSGERVVTLPPIDAHLKRQPGDDS